MLRGRASRALAQGAAIQPATLTAPASTAPALADFADFVRSSQAKMVRLAELLTSDQGRAEDLAQDGYAKGIRSLGPDPRRRPPGVRAALHRQRAH